MSGIPRGFTLIELLVVITIIVVLLALLTPALDRAIYQAELVTCAAQQDAIMTGATAYAFEFKRAYPHRSGCDDNDMNYGPGWVKANTTPASANGVSAPTDYTYGSHDDRRVLQGYVALSHMLCPLAPDVDIGFEGVHAESWIGIPYVFWFGFHYDFGAGMRRLGNRIRFAVDDGSRWSFNVMVADVDGTNSGGTSYSAHPDDKGMLQPRAIENQPTVELVWDVTLSDWVRTQSNRHEFPTARGKLDRNVGYTDGSVERFNDIGLHPVLTPTDTRELADHPMRPMPYTERGVPTDASMSGYAYWMPQ